MRLKEKHEVYQTKSSQIKWEDNLFQLNFTFWLFNFALRDQTLKILNPEHNKFKWKVDLVLTVEEEN